ncbi:LytTR family transcriptional regulator DNA-binding domain-containing protein [Tenuibacillus multivorans]|uniref:ABC-2 type transport system ATP-binding protein n=1 Tax=Tenuibacillus multivorans TaxID=237069 RepID=A0A1H0DXY4_9BACI|nr:LytTR family transcriptional regulator DNA-binding domain-containing protein [Tenuibacillus multivorans]GEL76734.1 transcriptional regulator [Tenuibacillus multivorans]SDN74975.1 ABC-2 type transport system ATP-binding protein [Tenuibacillus multivorans]
MLKLKQAEKIQGHSKMFSNVDLEIRQGDCVTIHINADTRVTLMQLLTGKEELSSGDIWIDQQLMTKGKKPSWEKVGFLFLNDGLYDRLTVRDYIKFNIKLFGSTKTVEEVLNFVQLTKEASVKIGHLTFSKRQRLLFARLYIHNAPLMILSDPDQNVDIESKRIIINGLNQLQKEDHAILVLTSNMESALTFSNHVYRMDERGLHEVNESQENNHDEEKLDEQVDTTLVEFNKIPTKVNDKIILFDPVEIDYIESIKGSSYVYVGGSGYQCTFTLNDLESKLLSFGFYRCHRSYIVNLQKVREVITWTRNSFSLMIDDGEESKIPLSKNKMAELKDMLGL